MQNELQALFGREVDLVDKEGLRNPWRKREIMGLKLGQIFPESECPAVF